MEYYYFDILILSGGNDVKLEIVEESNTDELNSAIVNRNNMELNLIGSFLQCSKPIFGICHGLQIINHYFGGTLKKVKSRDNHVSNEHEVTLESSEAQNLFGSKIMVVNSFHNYAIDNVGNSLNIDAVSLDGEVEMLTNLKKKVYAFMWHPERFLSDTYFMNINQNLIYNIATKKLDKYSTKGKLDFIVSSISKDCGFVTMEDTYKCNYYKPLISQNLIN